MDMQTNRIPQSTQTQAYTSVATWLLTKVPKIQLEKEKPLQQSAGKRGYTNVKSQTRFLLTLNKNQLTMGIRLEILKLLEETSGYRQARTFWMGLNSSEKRASADKWGNLTFKKFLYSKEKRMRTGPSSARHLAGIHRDSKNNMNWNTKASNNPTRDKYNE